MTDPFDDLERQLRCRVADSAPTSIRRRGRRGLHLGRGPLFAFVAALSISGGALAATTLRLGDAGRDEGRAIARRAEVLTSGRGACALRPAPQTMPTTPATAVAPVAEVFTDALPWLPTPASSVERRRADALIGGVAVGIQGKVIPATVHTMRFGRTAELLVFVENGSGTFGLRDPEGCGRQRDERAAELSRGRPEPVGRWAREYLARRTDVAIDAQTLHVTQTSTAKYVDGRPQGWGGTSITRAPGTSFPGRAMPTGVLMQLGNGRYTGLAGADAARILVQPARRGQRSRVPREVRTQRGFWMLDLPPGTGPVRVLEVDERGAVLRRLTLRG